MKKRVNGVDVDMTPAEEAGFLASLVPSLEHAKAQKRQAIIREWATREDVGAVFDYAGSMAAYAAQILSNARALRADLNRAATVAEVDAINEKAGWP